VLDPLREEAVAALVALDAEHHLAVEREWTNT
jgi:hypothetical protein